MLELIGNGGRLGRIGWMKGGFLECWLGGEGGGGMGG